MSEVIVHENPTDEKDSKLSYEELMADNEELAHQNDLLMKQYIGLEDRFNQEKAKWRQYKADVLGENEEIRTHALRQERQIEKLRAAGEQERNHRVATVPMLVVISAAAMALVMVSCMLQKLCVIGPQLSYGIECGLMMVVSWCYALIWDRTRK